MGCNSEPLTPNGLRDHLHDSMQSHLTLVCQKLKEVEHKLVQERKQEQCNNICVDLLVVANVVLLFVIILLINLPPTLKVHLMEHKVLPMWDATSTTEPLEIGWQWNLLRLHTSTSKEVQQTVIDRNTEALINTLQVLKATHETDMRDLYRSVSNIITELEQSLMELQCMRVEVENLHKTTKGLKEIEDTQVTQSQLLEDTGTCTLEKMQYPTEKGNYIGSWHHKPTCSARIPKEPHLVGSQDVEQCTFAGDYIRLAMLNFSCSVTLIALFLYDSFILLLYLSTSSSFIRKLLDTYSTMFTSGIYRFALVAFSIAGPIFIYPLLSYPISCFSFTCCFVSAFLCLLLPGLMYTFLLYIPMEMSIRGLLFSIIVYPFPFTWIVNNYIC